ncbi:MAG TPA: amidohydrolase family protein [Chloroflexota bacterium]|nr:amidohydrolase family protein [Chloroflexota bacterium]
MVAIADAKGEQSPAESRRRVRHEIIDCDVHPAIDDYTQLHPYLPETWRRHVKKSGFGGPSTGIIRGQGGLYRTDVTPPDGGEPGSDPDWLRQQLVEQYNVKYAILNGGNILGLGTMPDPDFASAIAAAYNDWTIDFWLTKHNADGRFKSSLFVAPQDPEAAAKEIDRHGSHPHIAQVLFTTATEAPLGHKRYHPIYEAAERHGLPVAVHPGAEGRAISGAPTAAGWVSKYIEWHTCLSQGAQAHAVSLVCQGVFVKFPKLKFVFVECGVGWFAHVMWRLDKNYKALRNEVPWLTMLPSDYMKEHIRLTTQPIEEPPTDEQFLQMLEMMDAKRTLMLSTDYPHWDFDDPLVAFARVPDDLKRRIFFENAAELYGLK